MRRRIEFGKGWGIGVGINHFTHRGPTLSIQPLFGSIYVPLPMFLFSPLDPDDYQCLGHQYGFSWNWSGYRGDLFLNWRNKCWIIHMPWDWKHVRHEILMADGSWRRVQYKPLDAGGLDHDSSPWDWTDKWQEKHKYRYVLRKGTIQEVEATIGVEEREWRWRWFTWLPFPRKVHRTIDVHFSGEVGERSGSWKGGCVGCGYDMLPGEEPVDTLRRMERERAFN